MTNQELLEKQEVLNACLGQIIDLEKGLIPELVIVKDNSPALPVLKETIASAIRQIDDELEKDSQ